VGAGGASVKVETIRDVVSRGKARHPELAGRMEKAAMLLILRRVEPETEGIWRVESEREPDRFYRVMPDGCECPDIARAPRGYCKHRIAVLLLLACREHEQQRKVATDKALLAYAAGWR
jgi:hypothetical protein